MKNNYIDEKIGEVRIADDVVAVIAGIATMEVDGVASMAGNITKEIISKLAMKNLSKGVKVEVFDGTVTAYLAIYVKYGFNIPEISKLVQDKVKNSIENMTGLEVTGVHISIAGVTVEK
ncbi:MAG: Asp23/Gls24 family envelope stress response protein [Lachnospiraceae bacterium]|nr:Asp23/Gls24 family envelope stress response protein [Lachnospiraceae bacterium]